MSDLSDLLGNNRRWAAEIQRSDPGFFQKLAQQQTPQYLWIGCSDSRVPANQIVDLLPGAIFVHRNVANQVHHTDLNSLSVIHFAVTTLRVRHIIVCGHYRCGGVQAALEDVDHGLIDNWLRPLRRLYHRHAGLLDSLPLPERIDLLCELNVIEQAYHVCNSTVVQHAWRTGQDLTVHGLIYGLHDGLLRDLDLRIGGLGEIEPCYQRVLAGVLWRDAGYSASIGGSSTAGWVEAEPDSDTRGEQP
jgi:carbonic anhydrase